MENQETIVTGESEKSENEEESEEDNRELKFEKKILYYNGICPKCRNNCGGGRLHREEVNFICKKCKKPFSKKEDDCKPFTTCNNTVLKILDDLILRWIDGEIIKGTDGLYKRTGISYDVWRELNKLIGDDEQLPNTKTIARRIKYIFDNLDKGEFKINLNSKLVGKLEVSELRVPWCRQHY